MRVWRLLSAEGSSSAVSSVCAWNSCLNSFSLTRDRLARDMLAVPAWGAVLGLEPAPRDWRVGAPCPDTRLFLEPTPCIAAGWHGASACPGWHASASPVFEPGLHVADLQRPPQRGSLATLLLCAFPFLSKSFKAPSVALIPAPTAEAFLRSSSCDC